MNVLQSTFPCGGSTSTVATVRAGGESIADLAARHDAAVARALVNCDNAFEPLGMLITAWSSGDGAYIYSSSSDYGQAQHDADVLVLQGIYPPN